MKLSSLVSDPASVVTTSGPVTAVIGTNTDNEVDEVTEAFTGLEPVKVIVVLPETKFVP